MSPESLPEVLPENVMPGVAFPPVGSVGRGSPPSPVLGAAKTTPCPSRVASLDVRCPIPRLLHGVRGVPLGLMAWVKPPGHARAFGRPVPQSGNDARRQAVLPTFPSDPSEDMPRSQTPVVSCALACIAPRMVAFRCVPTVGFCLDPAEALLADHDSTYFGAP